MPTENCERLTFYFGNKDEEQIQIADLKDITLTEAEELLRPYYFERVVHCRFCINNKANTDGDAESWCYKFGYECNDDDYCSYGELVQI